MSALSHDGLCWGHHYCCLPQCYTVIPVLLTAAKMRSSLFPNVPHCHFCLQSGGATNFMDRAIINCAHYLEEALAWGFDIDVWRAHLSAQTWPEVNSLLCWYISVVQLVLKTFSPRSHK